MEITYENTDHCMATLETFLNHGSWIPIVHFGTAVGRILLAAIEIVAGIAFAFFRGMYDLVTFDQLVCYRFWRNISYIGHGAVNAGRSFLELIPFSFLFSLLYDKTIGRMEYKYERILQPVII